MKKLAGLKIGTGDREKVLIDEFGAPTKEGLLAAVIGVFSALGALIIAKDILMYKITKLIKKEKKKIRKAKTAKVKLKNKALKQQVKANASDLKQQLKLNSDLLKERERLLEELSSRPVEPTSLPWKLIKKFLVIKERVQKA